MPMQSMPISEAKSTLRAVASEALASALILGIDECSEAGSPLSQTQRVHMAIMAIMSYDHVLAACDTMEEILPFLVRPNKS